MLAAARLSRVARRVAIVGGQRQVALKAVRTRHNISVRGLTSIAQTDRVCCSSTQLAGELNFLQDTITRLLYSIGTKREVERHLRIFSSSSHPSQPAKFAVIKVGGAVLGPRE